MRVKLMLVVATVLLLNWSGPARADGFTVWGLAETNVKSTQTSVTGRVGYQIDSLEPFIGYRAWPEYEDREGNKGPPDAVSIGSVYHLKDILDPENPVPWISPILLTFIPPGFEATPYFGGQATWNVDHKTGGFYGGMAGLLMKGSADYKSSLVVEGELNNNFGDLDGINDDWKVGLGFRLKF